MSARMHLRRSSGVTSPCEPSGGRGRRLLVRRPILFVCAAAVLLASCAAGPPSNTENACAIFEERRGWWDAVRDSERRWGAPPELQLAILNQESSFDRNARPPHRKVLFVIPTPFRESSSYGFAQATRSTWDDYREDTGKRFADRDSFRDATDFVGWYAARSHRLSGIALDDARNQYLAYMVGQGAYNRRRYNRDATRRADRVGARAALYRRQLDGCRRRLDRRFLFIF